MRINFRYCVSTASVLLLLLVVVIAAASRNLFENELASVIRVAVHDGTRQFRLDTCVKDSWDTVYVVPPYSHITEVAALIGCSPHDLRGTEIEKSDSVCLLIFVESSNVRTQVDCPRSIIDFSKIPTNAIHRKDATFDIELAPDGWRYALQAKPMRGRKTSSSTKFN